MTVSVDREADRESAGPQFRVEDVTTGIHASGFGEVGDGRRFSFHTERHHQLVVEVYRPWLTGVVPHTEDVIAVAARSLTNIDITDERSIIAAVRDAIASAHPVARAAARSSR